MTSQDQRPERKGGPAPKPPGRRRVLRHLRRLIPDHPGNRPLSWTAAERLAMAQARELGYLARLADEDIVDFITGLPVCRIRTAPDFPCTSASFWSPKNHHWVIVVRATDPEPTRRTGILREFKRILDQPQTSRLYDPRHPYGTVQAEMAADCFAARALMPDREFRRIYNTTPAVSAIARHFHVDEEQVITRLSELQLTERKPKGPRRA